MHTIEITVNGQTLKEFTDKVRDEAIKECAGIVERYSGATAKEIKDEIICLL